MKSFFYRIKDGFFYWGKKTLEGRVSILDILNPPPPNEIIFFIGSNFFTGEKKPLKEGLQFFISKIHHHQMKLFLYRIKDGFFFTGEKNP